MSIVCTERSSQSNEEQEREYRATHDEYATRAGKRWGPRSVCDRGGRGRAMALEKRSFFNIEKSPIKVQGYASHHDMGDGPSAEGDYSKGTPVGGSWRRRRLREICGQNGMVIRLGVTLLNLSIRVPLQSLFATASPRGTPFWSSPYPMGDTRARDRVRGQFAACGMTPVPTEYIRTRDRVRGQFAACGMMPVPMTDASDGIPSVIQLTKILKNFHYPLDKHR